METFLFGLDLGPELKNLVLVILLETREDTKIRRYEDTKIRRYEDTKIRRYEDTKIRRYEDTKINKVIDLVNKPKMV